MAYKIVFMVFSESRSRVITHLASQIVIALAIILLTGCGSENSKIPDIPVIEGSWWNIAGNPDTGPFSKQGQTPVDFTIFKAKDGTWQLWGCQRGTSVKPGERLLYKWESERLTDVNWTPKGIGLIPDTTLGEQMVQSPYCFKENGLYNMLYSDYNTPQICLMTSTDGKNFTRVLNKKGRVGLWEMSQTDQFHGRDPMVIKVGDLYYCYYTAHPDSDCAIYCRTSVNMAPGDWSDYTKVCYGGSAGHGRILAESPFVFFHNGWYYLFRTQEANVWPHKCFVYASKNPMEFCYDNDKYLVTNLELAQPEIIEDQGQLYMATFKPDKQGYRMARLVWKSGHR